MVPTSHHPLLFYTLYTISLNIQIISYNCKFDSVVLTRSDSKSSVFLPLRSTLLIQFRGFVSSVHKNPYSYNRLNQFISGKFYSFFRREFFSDPNVVVQT